MIICFGVFFTCNLLVCWFIQMFHSVGLHLARGTAQPWGKVEVFNTLMYRGCKNPFLNADVMLTQTPPPTRSTSGAEPRPMSSAEKRLRVLTHQMRWEATCMQMSSRKKEEIRGLMLSMAFFILVGMGTSGALFMKALTWSVRLMSKTHPLFGCVVSVFSACDDKLMTFPEFVSLIARVKQLWSGSLSHRNIWEELCIHFLTMTRCSPVLSLGLIISIFVLAGRKWEEPCWKFRLLTRMPCPCLSQ